MQTHSSTNEFRKPLGVQVRDVGKTDRSTGNGETANLTKSDENTGRL